MFGAPGHIPTGFVPLAGSGIKSDTTQSGCVWLRSFRAGANVANLINMTGRLNCDRGAVPALGAP